MARNITVGIDVGSSAIRVVVAEYIKNKQGKSSPTIIGSSVSPSKGLKHGYVIDEHDAVKSIRVALRAAEQSSHIKIKSVFLSVGGIGLESVMSRATLMVTRADEQVTELDVEQVVSMSREHLKNIANKKIIDSVPICFKVDGKEVLGKPVGMKGGKLEVQTLFITSIAQHIDDLVHAVEHTGVEVEDVVASPIAASLVALTKKQRTVGCLLANIGAETVSISVFEDNIPISLHVFPIGSTDITNDIALGLQVPLEEAEVIKMEYSESTYSKRKLDEIIEARLSDIFELIEAHLKKIKRNGLLPAGVIITGGGAGISTIQDFAKVSLQLPTRIASAEFIGGAAQGRGNDSAWFVAYGLCIFGFTQARDSKKMHLMRAGKDKMMSWIKQILP